MSDDPSAGSAGQGSNESSNQGGGIPSQAPVVVVGGGVMGCSTLYHLAKAGVTDAILLERNQLTSGTTWHSAAQVRALRSSRNLTDLIRYSIALYSSLEQETGHSTGWINKGSLSIATTPDRLEHIRRQQTLAELFGVQAYSVSAAEAAERWPLMNSDDVLGAVWSPDDGRVSPSDLCAALAKGARQRGCRIVENTAVSAIHTDHGKVSGLETTQGPIRCDAVVLCTGLWSREAGAMAGVAVPVYPCEHFYLLTRAIEGIEGNLPTLSDHDRHLYIRDDSGGLLIGCFEPQGKPISPQRIGTDAAFQLLPEDWDHFAPMMDHALHRIPALADAEVRTLLNGPESFTPDGSFILGETETRGLFLGCGMNSVGVATGGGAGMALAHCIVEGYMPGSLGEADPRRFAPEFDSARVLAERVPQVLGRHYAIGYPALQWSTSRNLRCAPLHRQWQRHRAHFAQSFAWERPLYFDKTAEPEPSLGRPAWFEQVGREVGYAHRQAAVFDLSTLGKIEVSGASAEAFLNRLCANDMTRTPGSVIYTAMLNHQGGFESDLTVLRLSDQRYRLYVGTDSIRRDLSWLRRHLLPQEQVRIQDQSAEIAVLALMGPRSAAIASVLGAVELETLQPFRHCETGIAGCRVRAVRMSYVGEQGWELNCRASDAERVFKALFEAGARPAGLLAQTSMRIEKRFLAFGHDLDADINPLQAGLEFAVDWRSDFIGRQALLALREQRSGRRVLSLRLDDTRAVPMGNEAVYHNDCIIGSTTSATFGYRVGKPLAIALIETAEPGEFDQLAIELDIAQRRYAGRLLDGPAYRSGAATGGVDDSGVDDCGKRRV